MAYWTLGFSKKEQEHCTRLPPYQFSMELCLVLLLLNINQNEMKVLCIFYDIKYVAGIFYSIYILSTLRLKSTSSRKCKDDCVSEEKIRIWEIEARTILFLVLKATCCYQMHVSKLNSLTQNRRIAHFMYLANDAIDSQTLLHGYIFFSF